MLTQETRVPHVLQDAEGKEKLITEISIAFSILAVVAITAVAWDFLVGLTYESVSY